MKKVYIKNLIFSGLAVVIFCISFFFLYRQISLNNKSFTDSSVAFNLEEQRREEIQSLNKVLSQIQNETLLLDSHFLRSEDIAPFLDALEKSATLVGASAEVVSVDSQDPKNKGISIGVKTTGSFESIYKFLLLLENSKYELSVVSTKIIRESAGSESESNNTPKWRADFTIKIISFLEN